MSKPLVRFIIADTHMGLGHEGLEEVISLHKKQSPLFARALKTESDLILFVNKSLTAAKLYASGGRVIGYLRLPRGRVITERTIGEIPATFGRECRIQQGGSERAGVLHEVGEGFEKGVCVANRAEDGGERIRVLAGRRESGSGVVP